jgi:hypothetical protein
MVRAGGPFTKGESMNRMLRRFAIILALIGLAAAVAATRPAAVVAGSNPTTTVQVPASATLVPGPGVSITITYKCLPSGGYYGFADVQVSEGTASSTTFFTPTCNGSRQRATVFVAGTFQAGNAKATALVCGFDCNTDTRNIKIR